MVTVCRQCKAVYKFGVMECHETMNKFVMECHDEVVLETQWSMLLIFIGQGVDRQRRDEFNNGETPKSPRFIREGTVKQGNNKTWKATYFRSGAHSLQVNEN